MALKKAETVALPEVAAAQEQVAATIADHSTPVADTPQAWEEQPEQANEVVVAAQPAQQVAVAVQPRALATVPADDGFGALDGAVGFGSFPICKLDKTKFVIDKSEYDEFVCVIMSARPKWVHKANDENLAYSYDNETTVSGKSLKALAGEWVAKGACKPGGVEVSKYMECMAEFRSPGIHQGKIVLLSVPPASINRLGGHRAELSLKRTSAGEVRTLSNTVTRVHLGPKIVVNPKVSFYPWAFEIAAEQADKA